MPNGEFLVVVRKRVFTVDPVSKNVRQVFRFPRGNKPAHRGVCVTESGTIFMGEYVINLDRRHPISLYRSRDFGQSFTIVLAFEPGEVRHIHFVQWDRFAQCLWLGTGDADSECRLYRSDNQGDSWELVGGGNQLWRTVGIAFQEKAIYWGTDAGSDTGSHPNHVIRFDRITGELSKLEKLQGPCHGTASLKDGTIVVSTGVEGGQNEIDDRAHLWCSSDGKNWSEALSFRKDHFPYLMQYGVLRFPQGLDSCATLAFTGMGLVGAGEKAFWAELV
jgi:hypothetical protein